MKVALRCGARPVGVKMEIACVIPLMLEVFRDHGHPFVITSFTDGKHAEGSLHRFGLAVDIDFMQDKFDEVQGRWLAGDLETVLGSDYDVVFEGNHIHVEFDPKVQPIVTTAE
jgi:hypothetical protein